MIASFRQCWLVGVEVLAITALLTGLAALAVRFAMHHLPMTWGSLVLALLLVTGAYLAADFFSGFVHFLGDTFFHESTPLIGKAFIRPFREHHRDATLITTHDFIEVNGSNSLVSLPALFVGHLVFKTHPWVSFFLFWFLLSIFATNQFHKWAHATKTPGIVRGLQRCGLILNPERHNKHHISPFQTDFCITTGWLNPILSRLHIFPFFRRFFGLILPVGRQKKSS